MKNRAIKASLLIAVALLLIAAIVLSCVIAAERGKRGIQFESVKAESLPMPEEEAPATKTQCELCGGEAYGIAQLNELAYVVNTNMSGGGGTGN